ncbi:5-carboxymethyl-2-hydroxymuconate semialdehyde dehydrogenase [Profundibacter sp.]|uniref:5-carboxymethyl-2-hydroxymuconate semialdehyde dehydrogenase n=1 Tax=Profundibacter sp. TaxID=3101071 RepID=UPI003D121131
MTSLQSNIAAAETYLEHWRDCGVQNHIAGQTVPASGGETFENTTPVDMSRLCDVARGTVADINAAAQAAAHGFTIWRDVSGKDRRDILHAIADGIEDRAEEIALLESLDTGQAIRFMSKAAIRGAENFRFYADKAIEARDGKSIHAPGQMNVTSRFPLGPVGVITPWNTPFMLSTWKIAPALAAGCTVVHKPAELSPITAKILVEIAEQAGLPTGVWNTVNGFGEEVGKALCEHPLIRAIAFVGESATGSAIMAQGAATLKRLHLELGGKNPVIVFEDADLDRAAEAAIFMIYSLNGERCTSSSRLLVQASIYDELTARIAKKAAAIKVGHPLDPNTVIGPLISQGHQAKVMSFFDTARAEGATIATGGERVGQTGCYVAPTLFTGAKNDMAIARQEIFGPVLTAIPFADEADALRMANDTDYGLAAYLWTNDLTRALRMTERLETGMIWVNSENKRHLPTPFGGVKASGIGRDGGDWSFDFYMETRNVSFATTAGKIPQLGG